MERQLDRELIANVLARERDIANREDCPNSNCSLVLCAEHSRKLAIARMLTRGSLLL